MSSQCSTRTAAVSCPLPLPYCKACLYLLVYLVRYGYRTVQTEPLGAWVLQNGGGAGASMHRQSHAWGAKTIKMVKWEPHSLHAQGHAWDAEAFKEKYAVGL